MFVLFECLSSGRDLLADGGRADCPGVPNDLLEDKLGEAPAQLGDVRVLFSFIESAKFLDNLVQYSSEISTASSNTESRIFDVMLKWKRNKRARFESYDRSSQESSRTFRIAEKNLLGVIRSLAACPTWTHAKFLCLNQVLYLSLITISRVDLKP